MASNSEFSIKLPSNISDITISAQAKLRIGAQVTNRPGTGSSRVLRLREALGSAPLQFANILDRILREAISAGIWRLRNGGTGDIIDSGELLRSQAVTVSGSSIQISYDVPYAALIHYGGYIVPYGSVNRRPIYIPPRPWVALVLSSQFNGYDLTEIYSDIIKRIISNI